MVPGYIGVPVVWAAFAGQRRCPDFGGLCSGGVYKAITSQCAVKPDRIILAAEQMQHRQIGCRTADVTRRKLTDDWRNGRKSIRHVAAESQRHHAAIADAQQIGPVSVRFKLDLNSIHRLFNKADVIVTGRPGTAIALAALRRTGIFIRVSGAM